MEPLAVSIACLLLLVAAIVLEFWVPSFGLLTLSAVALFIVSVFYGFQHSGTAGALMLAANMLAAALTILLTMHWMKASPLSNRLEVLPGAKPAVLPRTPPPPKLLGKVGVASSPLRPAGTALIDDLRVEVVTEGDWIDRGASVEVIRVNGSVVTVREAVEKRET